MEPTQSAGAAAFIGSVLDPGNTYHYYVPYAIIQAKIPGASTSLKATGHGLANCSRPAQFGCVSA